MVTFLFQMESFLESALEEGLAVDATLASNLQESRQIWALREAASECLPLRGATYKYDFSLPVDKMYEIVEATRTLVAPFLDAIVVGYGHVGDGNVHLNISHPTKNEELQATLEPVLYEWVAKHQGSISAEHGIG